VIVAELGYDSGRKEREGRLGNVSGRLWRCVFGRRPMEGRAFAELLRYVGEGVGGGRIPFGVGFVDKLYVGEEEIGWS